MSAEAQVGGRQAAAADTLEHSVFQVHGAFNAWHLVPDATPELILHARDRFRAAMVRGRVARESTLRHTGSRAALRTVVAAVVIFGGAAAFTVVEAAIAAHSLGELLAAAGSGNGVDNGIGNAGGDGGGKDH